MTVVREFPNLFGGVDLIIDGENSGRLGQKIVPGGTGDDWTLEPSGKKAVIQIAGTFARFFIPREVPGPPASLI